MSTSYVIKTGLTASTNTSYTLSMWVKFTKESYSSGSPYLWSCGAQGSGAQGIYINNSDTTLAYYGHSGYTSHSGLSNGSMRDLFGWVHIVWSVNAGTGTFYINGVQQGSTRSGIAPLNAHGGTEMALNTYVGTSYSTYDDSGVLMSHVHFVDGTAYNANTFGSTDSTTGEWKIKTDPGLTQANYGTNGFFLFKDNASVNDQSGNSNNFTATGSVIATQDNPSNVFCTGNPLAKFSANVDYANGNNTFSSTSGWYMGAGTLGASTGKYYFEYKITTLGTGGGFHKLGFMSDLGIANSQAAGHIAETIVHGGYAFYCQNGNLEVRTDSAVISGYDNSTLGVSFSNNDVMCLAVDMDNKRAYFRKNGDAWIKSGDPVNGTNGLDISADYPAGRFMIPAFASYYNGVGSLNFGNGYFGTTAVSSAGTNASGNGIFEFNVPNGYTALSTKGLNL
tara:strand:- start:1515 stop:2864 length:1350 start_codon:yes stop_codon:yes gene_type:complete